MVQPRLEILSTLNREVLEQGRAFDGQYHSAELVGIDGATGLATVRVRGGFAGETVDVSGIGVLFPDATRWMGFDVLVLAPTGNLNGPSFLLGPIQRGDVVFGTTGLEIASTVNAIDRLVGPSTPAFDVRLAGTETVLISSVVVALDNVHASRPFVRLEGATTVDWFAAGTLPEIAEDTLYPSDSPVCVTFTGDTPFRLQAGTTLRLRGFAQRSSVLDGSWRGFLTTDTPPAGQALTVQGSPASLPIVRLHGTVES